MLTMLPNERPEFVNEPPQGDGVIIKLSHGPARYQITTFFRYKGKKGTGIYRVHMNTLGDKLTTDRMFQKAIKLSFYRACLRSGLKMPVWGALTGIRPAKITTKELESGSTTTVAKRLLVSTYYVSPERADLCIDASLASLEVKKLLLPRDICLYVGIPFCPTRCAYCSFVSNSVEKSMHLVQPYLDALKKEISAAAALVRELKLRVISVYIGGGTPTTLSAEQFTQLDFWLKSEFDFSAVREYTVEAGRPDTFTSERLAALENAGVTRISINPQSMEDEVLRAIGRNHSAQQAHDAFTLAQRFKFGSINADLIAGLPADSLEGFKRSLDAVLEYQPQNITVHNLSRKRGAKLSNESAQSNEIAALPSDEEIGAMLSYASKSLRSNGYKPYYLYRQKFMAGGFENVGWSKEGYESLYNVCIMEELRTILALGAGSSTKLVNPATGRIERIFDPKYPYEYIERIDKIISDKNQMREFYSNEPYFAI